MHRTPQNDRLLNEREVSERFGLGISFLRLARSRGTGGPPVVSVGPKLKKYRPDAVSAWIRERESTSAVSPSKKGAGK